MRIAGFSGLPEEKDPATVPPSWENGAPASPTERLKAEGATQGRKRGMDEQIEKVPFFRTLDWSAFWTSLLLSFAVYFFTLAPTVTLEDAGELAVAADSLGVPHPPGYPIWTMLGWVFTKVFAFVTYRGQPNPAWSIGLMSAVFGALASGITALLICCSGYHILRRSRLLSHDMDEVTESAICWVGGVVGSLLFAFTPIMWSQAIIVEVYSLNAFFLVLVLLLVYMWLRRPSRPILFWASFLFGLGLTNYQVLLLAGLALAICIMLKDFELFRDFVIAAVPYGVVFALMSLPIMPGGAEGALRPLLPAIVHPLHVTFFMYMLLNLVWLTVIYFLFPRGRTVASSILLAQLGVSVYVYMPIVSDLRNPPMNWGYPRTWDGFKHALSRGQYERIAPSDVFSPRFLDQIGAYLADLRLNFTLLPALVGFLPFTVWRIKHNGREYSALKIATLLAGVALLASVPPLDRIGPLYKLPVLGIVLLMSVGGIAIIVGRMRGLIADHLLDERARPWERLTTICVAAGAVAIVVLALVREIVKITKPLRNGAPLSAEASHDILLRCLIIPAVLILLVLVVAAVNWLLARKDSFELTIDDESQKWIVSTSIAFLMLSIGLIALANLKMDVQDMFIQRVKFISSHALFAFWIGYGLIFLLAQIDGWVGRGSGLKWLAIVAAAALPAIPLYVNRYSEALLHVYGGAEQNGHDFGWQFGNYQLRGADAIIEELDPDEEPLPNPTYPPEMGPDAIFFGGTDPGRFVPTYMIYSAKVRPDVYLITQNALADNTYMAVMRDLYGNDIWIPSVGDSADAFRVFVEEVESGKRPANAGIVKQNGRVQVSGVLGVMEINGILAKNIFDYNSYKHDFYVEESYVIRWMYPYLTPHGLIMKINRQPLPRLGSDMAVVRDDLDFWDWYTRRLTSNEAFRRDVVARKSFSKLRSALAGLYAYRNMKSESEKAFLEARALYPLSPEANFRLAEVYMRGKQYAEARALMTAFGEADPANDKVGDFLKQLDRLEGLQQRIDQLQAQSKDGRIDANQALELADLYRQTGNMGHFNQLARSLLENQGLPAQIRFRLAKLYDAAGQPAEVVKALDLCLASMPADTPAGPFLEIAQLYGKANRPDGMLRAMEAYLRKQPNDWKVWLDHASLNAQLGKPDRALESLGVALRYGGTQAEQLIAVNPVLGPLRRQMTTRTRGLMNLGAMPNSTN